MKRRAIQIGALAVVLLFATCMASTATDTGRTINITASRFSFAPNEITVKKGESVTLSVASTDVNHGLVVEELGIRAEVKKGQTTTVPLKAETAGTFRGKCAHFCGTGHGSMTFTVHVVD